MDAYFSADVETDGPIPGPYSMLSFGLVYAGTFDGNRFVSPKDYDQTFYRELKPISDNFLEEALAVNGFNRNELSKTGVTPSLAMSDASKWINEIAGEATPVLIAFPSSFDWPWLHWYFVRFSKTGSPFGFSQCFDMKTAFAVKARRPLSSASRNKLPTFLRSRFAHTHNALDDAIEQADIFSKLFNWEPE